MSTEAQAFAYAQKYRDLSYEKGNILADKLIRIGDLSPKDKQQFVDGFVDSAEGILAVSTQPGVSINQIAGLMSRNLYGALVEGDIVRHRSTYDIVSEIEDKLVQIVHEAKLRGSSYVGGDLLRRFGFKRSQANEEPELGIPNVPNQAVHQFQEEGVWKPGYTLFVGKGDNKIVPQPIRWRIDNVEQLQDMIVVGNQFRSHPTSQYPRGISFHSHHILTPVGYQHGESGRNSIDFETEHGAFRLSLLLNSPDYPVIWSVERIA